MVQINYAKRTVLVRVVYCGPGVDGLELPHSDKSPAGYWQFSFDPPADVLQLAQESTGGLSRAGNMTLRVQVRIASSSTARDSRPGSQTVSRTQLWSRMKSWLAAPDGPSVRAGDASSTWLEGADGVVFVADSAPERLDENLSGLTLLYKGLQSQGLDRATLPMVFIWKSRPGCLAAEHLKRSLEVNERTCLVVEGNEPPVEHMRDLLIEILGKVG